MLVADGCAPPTPYVEEILICVRYKIGLDFQFAITDKACIIQGDQWSLTMVVNV